ncbi:hypothetical protein D3C72_1164470 [compost metagenome]
MPHHRIAGVVVREDEQCIGLVGHLLQLFGVFQIGGQRLVADDMDAALQKRLRCRIMHMVGGNDRHRLDAILAQRFLFGHFLERTIATLGIEPQLVAGSEGFFRRRGQGPRHEIETIVEPRRHAVNAADKCARTTTDHAKANPLVRLVRCLSFNSHNISPEMLSKPKHTAVGRIIGAA